jgi:hypothetical protein
MERTERLLGVKARFLSSPQVGTPVTFGIRDAV